MALTDILTFAGVGGIGEMARGGGTVSDSVSRNLNAVELPTGAGAGAVFPSVEDVDLGVTYGPTGAEFVGVLQQPMEKDVVSGVSYGAYGTEFTGIADGGGGVVGGGSYVF